MPIATSIRRVDPEREPDFADVLDRLQPALEARFDGHTVQLGRNAGPGGPVPVVVHDIGDAATETAIREELDRIDPEWSTWIGVSR